MADPLSDHEIALSAIREAELEHADRRLLESFIEDSAHRDRAAAYMLKRLPASGNSQAVSLSLSDLLSDWKDVVSSSETH